MKKINKILAVLLTVFVGCATGDHYSSYDTNDDNMLDENEFATAFDNDNQSYYDWDEDNDNRLDEDEWDMGMTTYYGDYDYDSRTFDDWDRNDDNFIDESEYAENSFELWDEDNNGYVDNNEYVTWNNDIL